MAERITYAKAQELADAILGAELKSFGGKLSIVLNAERPDNDDDLLIPVVPNTDSANSKVSKARAKELFLEREEFGVYMQVFKGYKDGNKYIVSCDTIPVAVHIEGAPAQAWKMLSNADKFDALPDKNKARYKRNRELVKQWISEIEPEYTASDFGL